MARRAGRGRAGRRLSAAEPVAFPLDRDLGYRVALGSISARRLADAHVRAGARAARFRGRRCRARQCRDGAALERCACDRARQSRAVHSCGPACRAVVAARTEPRARPHHRRRERHREGGRPAASARRDA